MKKLLYGSKQQSTDTSKPKRGNKRKEGKDNNDDNVSGNSTASETTATASSGGADRQVGEAECDGKNRE